MPLRYFLPLYLIAYFFAAFLWRSYVVFKKTGANPVVFKGTDDAHGFIGRVFIVIFALIITVVLVYSVSPEVYQYSVPIRWLELGWLRWVGVALLLLSLTWTLWAQASMGQSWRIGIDNEHRTPLVQTGVFGLSRNPIYLGMMFTLLGLFLVIPSAITLLTFAMGAVLTQIQVRLEEEFLTKTHGAGYAEYRQHVRRWI